MTTQPICPKCGEIMTHQLANSLSCNMCYSAAMYGVTPEQMRQEARRLREEWAREQAQLEAQS